MAERPGTNLGTIIGHGNGWTVPQGSKAAQENISNPFDREFCDSDAGEAAETVNKREKVGCGSTGSKIFSTNRKLRTVRQGNG